MKVFIFGSNGFLGKYVTEKFKQHENIEVIGLPHEVVDISKPVNFESTLFEPGDVAINCAAKVLLHENINLQQLFDVNVNGAINVALWVKKHNLKLIHCSTLAVYLKPWPAPLRESSPLMGLDLNVDPTGGYASSKLLGEIGVKCIKDNAIILRFSALYGPGMKWEGVLPKFIDLALKDETLKPVENQFIDFLHVEDAARAIFEVATKQNHSSSIINIASCVETSIVDLASMIVSLTGKGKVSKIESDKVNRACMDVSEMRKLNIEITPLTEGLKGVFNAN